MIEFALSCATLLCSALPCQYSCQFPFLIGADSDYNPAPWIPGDSSDPGTIWYWMREEGP